MGMKTGLGRSNGTKLNDSNKILKKKFYISII